MAVKVVRTKTKYTNLYYNENTKKYDVKYNYKVYNPTTQKNEYKQKWVYNISTISEAKAKLAQLQAQGQKVEDKDITLEGIYQLWITQAEATNKSKVTIRNTKEQYQRLIRFIPKETKLKNITDDVYYECFNRIKQNNYAEETVHSLNACFRKFLNLAYQKRLIQENPLHRAENIKTKKKQSEEYRVLTHEEFLRLDNYFRQTHFVRLGIDRYEGFRLFFNLLYYSGVRVGEALALTYNDFRKTDSVGMRISVTKSYFTEMKITKEPKNKKSRVIPIPQDVEKLFQRYKEQHLQRGGKLTDRVFESGYGTYLDIITKACKRIGMEHISPHGFRHTYISNLIAKAVPLPVIEKVSGDTQETILKTYSHLFEKDILQVLEVMQNLS